MLYYYTDDVNQIQQPKDMKGPFFFIPLTMLDDDVRNHLVPNMKTIFQKTLFKEHILLPDSFSHGVEYRIFIKEIDPIFIKECDYNFFRRPRNAAHFNIISTYGQSSRYWNSAEKGAGIRQLRHHVQRLSIISNYFCDKAKEYIQANDLDSIKKIGFLPYVEIEQKIQHDYRPLAIPLWKQLNWDEPGRKYSK